MGERRDLKIAPFVFHLRALAYRMKQTGHSTLAVLPCSRKAVRGRHEPKTINDLCRAPRCLSSE